MDWAGAQDPAQVTDFTKMYPILEVGSGEGKSMQTWHLPQRVEWLFPCKPLASENEHDLEMYSFYTF